MKTKMLVMPKKMFLFIIPAMLFFLTFWIYPILQLFFFSMTNFNGIDMNYSMVGLNNFKALFSEGLIFKAIKNTLIYAVILVCAANLLSISIALILNLKIRGKGIYRSAVYLPTLFSAIVVGFIWAYVYMPGSGMIASFLNMIGLKGDTINIIGNYKTALYGIIAVDVWKNIGTAIVIYLAGLQTIDDNLLEAGRIDGASEWMMIRHIKLPLLASSITINVILSVINGLKTFDYAFIMTNGGPGTSTHTLMYAIYKTAFIEQSFGKASAFSVVAFFVIAIITVLLVSALNKKEVEL